MTPRHRPAHALPAPLRRLLARLLLGVLWLAVLAPGAGRVLAAASNEPARWAVVCSSGLATPADSAPADPAGHLLGHCPGCAPHADELAAPAPTATGLPAPALPRCGLPTPHLHVARPLQAWASALPRAPPRTA